MKLKKANAVMGILSVLIILFHIGYSIFEYLTFSYNPLLSKGFACTVAIAVSVHAVLGMLSLFLQNDGTNPVLYPKKNIRTILQRVSAALILPFLLIHINTFSWMQKSAENGQTLFIILLIIFQILFFAVVITHIAVSITNGFITLGILSSSETRKNLDRIIFVAGALIFVLCVYSVVKTQIVMFLIH